MGVKKVFFVREKLWFVGRFKLFFRKLIGMENVYNEDFLILKFFDVCVNGVKEIVEIMN